MHRLACILAIAAALAGAAALLTFAATSAVTSMRPRVACLKAMC